MLVDLPINRIEVNKSKDKQNKHQTKTAGMTMKYFFQSWMARLFSTACQSFEFIFVGFTMSFQLQEYKNKWET